LLPEPTIDREVAAGALVARPLVGVELLRPIGVVQRRGKELGKTARRFMQLLLKQSLSSRDVNAPEDAERPSLRSRAERGNEEEPEVEKAAAEDAAAVEGTAEPSPVMDGSADALPEARGLAAAHAAS
jgi:hypothetical protein